MITPVDHYSERWLSFKLSHPRERLRIPRWTAQIPPLIDTSNPAICGGDRDRGVLLRGLLRTQVGVDLGAPAPWSALEDVGVM